MFSSTGKKDETNGNQENNAEPNNEQSQKIDQSKLSQDEVRRLRLARLQSAFSVTPNSALSTNENSNSSSNNEKVKSVTQKQGQAMDTLQSALGNNQNLPLDLNSLNQQNIPTIQPSNIIETKKENEKEKEEKEKEKEKIKDKEKMISELYEKKKLAWQYLAISYILHIRHSDPFVHESSIKLLSNFESFFSSLIQSDASYIVFENDGVPFVTDTLEVLLLDRFQKGFPTHSCSFKYLIQSYQRCEELSNRISPLWDISIPIEDQTDIIKSIRSIVVTFSGVALTSSELINELDFQKNRQEFILLLTADTKGRNFPPNFLERLLEDIDEDTLSDLLPHIWLQIDDGSKNLFSFESKRSGLNALIKLSNINSFITKFVSDPLRWFPEQIIFGNQIILSTLGSYLAVSCDDTRDLQQLFSGLSKDKNSYSIVNQAFERYRSAIHELQDGLSIVFRNIIRNIKGKEKVIEFFSKILKKNANRAKIQYDPLSVTTDGAMLNLNYIMLVLCQPIVTKDLKQKIDPKYFLYTGNNSIWNDVTRMSADSNEIKEMTEELLPDNIDFGFTTEIFCLTLESLHLGFSSVSESVKNLKRMIDYRRYELNRLGANIYNRLERHIDVLEDQFFGKLCHLLDPRFMNEVGRLYGFFCRWLLYLFQQKKDDNIKKLLSIIPEYFIEDMSRFFQLFADTKMHIGSKFGVLPYNREEVIKCILYLISIETPLKNIYERACLLEVLMSFLPNEILNEHLQHQNKVVHAYKYEDHEFNKFDICRKEFVIVLLQLYSDVERTGQNNQFYEKFRFRTIISRILKFLFQYKWHIDNLSLFWKNDPMSFIKFLNMLINDLIYMLDSALDGISEIKKEETEINSNLNEWNSLTEQQQQERTNNLGEKRNRIKGEMTLANECIELLQFISKNIIEPFKSDIILPRISTLISVYLDRLAGKTKELHVKNKELYNFQPKFLLTTIIDIFISLSSSEEFLDGIIEDEAHFRLENYNQSVLFLRKHNLMEPYKINLYETKLNIIIKKLENKKNIEAKLGNIPMEYLDPIMQTLMTDPVILPSKSNQQKLVMDRKVIERHLLNNPNNPFTREPLSVQELIPDQQLKNEINQWIEKKLKETK